MSTIKIGVQDDVTRHRYYLVQKLFLDCYHHKYLRAVFLEIF